MRFAPPRPARAARENIVPMINVVFLLLIFFLMSAQIAPPEPFEISPPATGGQPPPGTARATLYIAADGRLAYGAARGEAVFVALRDRDGNTPLPIRADAALPAGDLARLLPRLAAAGVTEAALITGAAP